MAELKFAYDPSMDKPTALQVVMHSVESLIDQGLVEGDVEQAVLDIVFDDQSNTVTAVIDDNKMIDQLASQDYIDNTNFKELAEETVRTYSVRTIRERLRLTELPLKKQIRYFILDYRRYYKMQMKEFINNPNEFYRLKAQFVTDFMGYMNIVLQEAAEGGNLAKLLGLTALVPKANSAGRKLGIDYKMINKVGGAPRALLNRTQMHFREFIDSIADVVFKNWRSKIAQQEELPEEPDEDLIENEEVTEEVPEMEEYSRNYSNELEGEEADGEIVELTPAEIELLHRESELNGDGKRVYSQSFKSIDSDELTKLDDVNNPLVDIESLKAQGFTKWAPIASIDDEKELREYLANGAMVMSDILFIKDETKVDLGKEVKFKRFSEKKLKWGYTKDLISQGYNERPLTTKYLQYLYDKGFKRFYMFEDEREADRYADKVLDKASELGLENLYEFDEVQDPELGKVWVIFTCTKVAKFFSKSLKKFSHK